MPVIRSELSVPASNSRMIEKAVASDADMVLIDLEDSVSHDRKEASRKNVIEALQGLDWGSKPPAYRMNALDTPYFYRDLIEVLEAAGDRVRVVVVPKVGRAAHLHTVATLLDAIEIRMGFEPRRIAIEAQIESAQGLRHVEAISEATERVAALNFGPGDYAASTRMPATSIGGTDQWDDQYPGHRFGYAMSRIVVAARAAGLRAVDGPVADFRDTEAFRRSCIVARSLGFDSKWCIHPSQIAIANEVFSPTEQERVWAQQVMDAWKQAAANGQGAASIDSTMIDEASIRMAGHILQPEQRK